jgi:hypothetical protein
MAKSKKSIEQYEHLNKMRKNNPPAGLVTPDTDRDGEKRIYAYDPHLDPQLVWAGKAEHTSFEVPTVSLHVHERIDPHTIIEAVESHARKRSSRFLWHCQMLTSGDESAMNVTMCVRLQSIANRGL